MTSVQKSRYALWHHHSQFVGTPVEWRQTPKSKALVAVVPPAVVPGQVTVKRCTNTLLEVQLDDTQVRVTSQWLSTLEPDVLPATACETGVLKHSGPYSVFKSDMKCTQQLPAVGERVAVRIVCKVVRIGPIRKAVLNVIDVLRNDVAAGAL